MAAVLLPRRHAARFAGRGNGPATRSASQYGQARPLFSPAERSFLGALEQAIGDDLRVMGKVRLADLVQPSPALPAAQRGAALNRVSRKHVDFVLCDRRTLAAVAVVELDDRSHRRADRRERDALVDGALTDAGLPVLRVPCQRAYSVADLQEQVRAVVTTSYEAARRPRAA